MDIWRLFQITRPDHIDHMCQWSRFSWTLIVLCTGPQVVLEYSYWNKISGFIPLLDCDYNAGCVNTHDIVSTKILQNIHGELVPFWIISFITMLHVALVVSTYTEIGNRRSMKQFKNLSDLILTYYFLDLSHRKMTHSALMIGMHHCAKYLPQCCFEKGLLSFSR